MAAEIASPPSEFDLKDYWQKCVEGLRRYAKTENARKTKYFNDQMAELTANAIASALGGSPPKDWPSKNENYTDIWTMPEEIISLRYIELCKAKIVIDNKPRQTIQREYGVNTRTITRWRKDFADYDYFWRLRCDEHGSAAAAAGERNKGWERASMLRAAQRYREANRKTERKGDTE